MSHLVPLISDLAMILTLAGLATILCKKLNQPLILGYMLAGFLASPHFSLLPRCCQTLLTATILPYGLI